MDSSFYFFVFCTPQATPYPVNLIPQRKTWVATVRENSGMILVLGKVSEMSRNFISSGAVGFLE